MQTQRKMWKILSKARRPQNIFSSVTFPRHFAALVPLMYICNVNTRQPTHSLKFPDFSEQAITHHSSVPRVTYLWRCGQRDRLVQASRHSCLAAQSSGSRSGGSGRADSTAPRWRPWKQRCHQERETWPEQAADMSLWTDASRPSVGWIRCFSLLLSGMTLCPLEVREFPPDRNQHT